MFPTQVTPQNSASFLMGQGGRTNVPQPQAPTPATPAAPTAPPPFSMTAAAPGLNNMGAAVSPGASAGLGFAASAKAASAGPQVPAMEGSNPGSINPQYNAPDAYLTPEVKQYIDDMNGIVSQATTKAGGSTANVNGTKTTFSIPSGPTVPSNALNTGTTLNDVLGLRQTMQNQMTSGSDTSYIPTSGYLAGLATNSPQNAYMNALYNTGLYSPQQLSAISSLANISTRINATNLAARQNINQMLENGSLTREQAQQFVSEAQRRSDQQLADLAVAQQGASMNLGVLNEIQKNQLGALSSLAPFFNPTTLEPGASIVSPLGGSMFTGSGASPSTIVSYAQSLKQNDYMTGNLQLNQDGTVNDAYYYSKAQQAFSGGFGGAGGAEASGAAPGAQGGNPAMGGVLPQSLMPYVVQSNDGSAYINADKVPSNQQDIIKQQSARAGVPYLTGEEVGKLRSIQVTMSNLSQLQQAASSILSGGLTGRTLGAAWNNISNVLQLNPEISSFQAYRDTAINTIQALAGGQGSGLRLNQGEINTAVSNLPTISDNIETASRKIQLVSGFLSKWQNELLTGSPVNTANGGNTSNVVQTTAGPVNTNW